MLTALAVGTSSAAAGRAPAAAPPAGSPRHAVPGTGFGAWPLSFAPNRGQAAPGVEFVAAGDGYGVALAAAGATLAAGQATVRLSLLGANRAARGQGQEKLPGTVGYVSVGRAPAGLASVPTYAAVRYPAVYPGIDLLYYGNRGHLEYDFRVRPGADPRRIRLAFDGAESLALAANGNLLVRVGGGVARQHVPVVYQVVQGRRRPVRGGYVLAGHHVAFLLGPYNPRLALVIDPVLAFSTYFGGAGDDAGNGVAVDARGDVYLVGTTTSGSATRVAFVAKLDPTGRHVLYTRYIGNKYGGSATACDATGSAIAVDGQGNAYVTGTYGDVDEFNLCNHNAVLWARFDPSGKGAYATFGQYDGNKGAAIALDGQDNAYITGSTDQWEANFPVTPGAFQPKPGIDREEDGVAGDAFVLKVSPRGTVVYGTFLGGSGIDAGRGIAVDSRGDAYVAGTTGSDVATGIVDFPTTAGAVQRRPANMLAAAFLSVLSADGSSLLYSTFLSGDNGESAQGVAVDAQGNAYVVGSTNSRTFPTSPNAYKRTCGTDGMCNATKTWYHDYSTDTDYWRIGAPEDVFVAMIDPRRSGAASLVYSTFLGGMNRDRGTAIAVDTHGRAYVTGHTASSDFPTVAPVQGALAGSDDAFVDVLDPRLAGRSSLLASTYLGGTGYDEADGIAVDKDGSAYVTGYTGSARTFPTYAALQATNAGHYDAFVTKIRRMVGGS